MGISSHRRIPNFLQAQLWMPFNLIVISSSANCLGQRIPDGKQDEVEERRVGEGGESKQDDDEFPKQKKWPTVWPAYKFRISRHPNRIWVLSWRWQEEEKWKEKKQRQRQNRQKAKAGTQKGVWGCNEVAEWCYLPQLLKMGNILGRPPRASYSTLTHAVWHSFAHPFIHSFIQPSNHSFIRSFIYSFVRSFARLQSHIKFHSFSIVWPAGHNSIKRALTKPPSQYIMMAIATTQDTPMPLDQAMHIFFFRLFEISLRYSKEYKVLDFFRVFRYCAVAV